MLEPMLPLSLVEDGETTVLRKATIPRNAAIYGQRNCIDRASTSSSTLTGSQPATTGEPFT